MNVVRSDSLAGDGKRIPAVRRGIGILVHVTHPYPSTCALQCSGPKRHRLPRRCSSLGPSSRTVNLRVGPAKPTRCSRDRLGDLTHLRGTCTIGRQRAADSRAGRRSAGVGSRRVQVGQSSDRRRVSQSVPRRLHLSGARASMAASTLRKRHAAQVVRALRRDYPDAPAPGARQSPAAAGGHDPLGPVYRRAGEHRDARRCFGSIPIGRRLGGVAVGQAGSRRSRAPVSSATRPRTSRPAASSWWTGTAARCPGDMEALVQLPGVGRKTANVVLGTAFGMATGVVVDTHVTRHRRRLGLTPADGGREDRAGPDGRPAAQRVDRFLASHDPPWAAGLQGPQAAL